jgi:hypothetical protein
MLGWSAEKKSWIRQRCKPHAIEGDISRHKMERQRGDRPDGAKRQCKPHNGVIDVERLPDTPEIVVRLGPEWLEKQMEPLTFAKVVTNGSCRWCKGTTKELDLTSGKPELEEVAKHVMAQVVGTTAAVEPMSACIEQVADIMDSRHYQAKPCFGAVAVATHTVKHQHTPLGVLNMCGAGSKEWQFWGPDWEEGTQQQPPRQPIAILQQAGDLLWFPPGWHHEVRTTGGTLLAGYCVAPHLVGWCIPKRLVYDALATLGCGLAKESQCPNVLSRPHKKASLYRAMKKYAGTPQGKQSAQPHSGPPTPTPIDCVYASGSRLLQLLCRVGREWTD